MERILIIGCPGAGKTTLALELGKKKNLPVVHLDQLWWKGNWENVTREEFDSRLHLAMNGEKWIMDGNYNRTLPQRIAACDTIVYLDFGRWECLKGMVQRVLGSYGKVRPDMAPGCPERFDWEFVQWIWNFNRDHRALNYGYIGQARHAKSVILKSRKEVKDFLESL